MLGGTPVNSDDLNLLARDIMDRISGKSRCSNNGKKSNGNGGDEEKNKLSLTPANALVIGGLLGGVLEVESVLIDKDQTVQIILEGSLRQKTQLEKMLDQIGSKPFDEVVKAMLERLS
jgi:hypothetical protein